MKLKDFTIKAFRGLQNISLQDLGSLNIITGDNSSGKTGILEAVYMMFGLTPQSLNLFPIKFRRQKGQKDFVESFWRWLYPQKNLNNSVILEGRSSEGTEYYLLSGNKNPGEDIFFEFQRKGTNPIRFNPSGGSFPNNWPKVVAPNLNEVDYSSDAEKYNEIAATSGGEERILALMQVVDSRVKKIRYLKLTQHPLVYVDVGLQNLIPVSQMGEAFSRVLSLYLEMLTCTADIIILDEVENGIHIDKMDTVWRGLAALAEQQKIQIIATTHSKECLKAAFEAVENKEIIKTRHYSLRLKGTSVELHSSDSFLES